MTLDSMTLHGLVRELNDSLVGGRLRRIWQLGLTDFLLLFWTGEEKLLEISLQPGAGKICEVEEKRSHAETPSSFCMLARKNLEGMRLTRVAQVGWDRIVSLDFTAVSREGARVERRLVLEIPGRDNNLYLLTGEEKLLGLALSSRVGSREERDLRPGRQYVPLPVRGRALCDAITADDLAAHRGSSLEKALSAAFYCLNIHMAREIAAMAGIPGAKGVDGLTGVELSQVVESVGLFTERVTAGSFAPCVVLSPDDPDRPIAVTPWELREYAGHPREVFPTFTEALSFYAAMEGATDGLETSRAEARAAMKKRLDKAQKRLSNQQRDFQALERSLEGKRLGELLLAHAGTLLPEGATVEVEDLFESGLVSIEIDPRLTVAQNAKRYFEKYKRAKRGMESLKKEMARSREEVADLEARLAAVEAAQTPEELKSAGATAAAPREKRLPQGRTPPRRYLFKGFEILVGRSPAQNDELTFHLAGREDIWLHARQTPGAHVVILRGGRKEDVPGEVVELAASYAAWFSRAKRSTKVAVDYTPAKYVHKPPGAAKGLVTYERAKSLTVRPAAPPDE